MPARRPRAATARRARRPGRPPAEFSARSQIVVGAAEAFGARGLEATSVEDICRAAGVVRSTFYRFYRSKEDVFSALLDTATTALVQSVRVAMLSARTTEDKLDAALEAYLRAQAFAGPLARVLVGVASSANPIGAARRDRSVAEFTELFREGLGAQAPSDELVYRALLAALETVSLALMDEGPMDEASIERGKRVLRLLVVGLLPPRARPKGGGG